MALDSEQFGIYNNETIKLKYGNKKQHCLKETRTKILEFDNIRAIQNLGLL
jgi:hypothetical protein